MIKEMLPGDPRIEKISALVDKDGEIIAMKAEAFEKVGNIIDDNLQRYIEDESFMAKVKEGDSFASAYWQGFYNAHKYIADFKTLLKNDITEKQNEKFYEIQEKVENGELNL